MSYFPGETAGEIMGRMNPKLQAQISRGENTRARERKMELMLAAPTLEEIVASDAKSIIISFGDEENRTTIAQDLDRASGRFLEYIILDIENGIDSDPEEIISGGFVGQRYNELSALGLEQLIKQAEKLRSYSEKKLDTDNVFLFIPGQKSFKKLLQEKGRRLGLDQDGINEAYEKHLQALKKNLTEEELECLCIIKFDAYQTAL